MPKNPIDLTFQKKQGNLTLNIAFFWRRVVDSNSTNSFADRFIPELFFDYFFIKRGNVKRIDETWQTEYDLPTQVLRTLYVHPVQVVFLTSLELFGARFSLEFAEAFWEEKRPNTFMEQNWLNNNLQDLDDFASQTVVGKGKVSLIFFEGILPQDPYGLLEGDGNKARTRRILSPDFNRSALQDYVTQILKSDQGRK